MRFVIPASVLVALAMLMLIASPINLIFMNPYRMLDMHIDKVFVPYIKKFEAIGHLSVGKVRIELVDHIPSTADEDISGYCMPLIYPQVYISRRAWNHADACDKEALLFHELGHCILLRAHKSARLPNGMPKSIMHPYETFSCSVYQPNFQYFMRELFDVRNRNTLFKEDADDDS